MRRNSPSNIKRTDQPIQQNQSSPSRSPSISSNPVNERRKKTNGRRKVKIRSEIPHVTILLFIGGPTDYGYLGYSYRYTYETQEIMK